MWGMAALSGEVRHVNKHVLLRLKTIHVSSLLNICHNCSHYGARTDADLKGRVRNGFAGYWWWENPQAVSDLVLLGSLSSYLFDFDVVFGFDWVVRSRKSDFSHVPNNVAFVESRYPSCVSSVGRAVEWKHSFSLVMGGKKALILILQEDYNQGRKGLLLVSSSSLFVCQKIQYTRYCTISECFLRVTHSLCIQLFPSHDILAVAWCSSHDGEVSCDVMP